MPFGASSTSTTMSVWAMEADNGAVHLFHCVEIADGTRTIDVGADVEFDVLVKFGHDEAANLRTPSVSERVFERANHQARSSAHWCTTPERNVASTGCTNEQARDRIVAVLGPR